MMTDTFHARKMGTLIDRVQRELTEKDVAKIAGTYHAWRGDKGASKYADVAGFCKSEKIKKIEEHGFVLTPGRYVGTEAVEDDGEPFEDKMKRLTAQLMEQMKEGEKLDEQIKENLQKLGFYK